MNKFIVVALAGAALASAQAFAAEKEPVEVKFEGGKSYQVNELDLVSEKIEVTDPKAFADKVADRVLTILRTKSSESEKEKRLVSLFENHVDTEWMAGFVLGRYNKTANEAQKKQYSGLYKDYMLYSYVPRFKSYSGESFQVVRVTDAPNDRHMAQMAIKQKDPTKPDIRVDYIFHNDPQGRFKIIDIIGEGVSLLSTQRSDFGSLIGRDGMDKFLGVLKTKVDGVKKSVK